MKKIIIPILALVIASCGGGNNQTQTQGGNTATNTADTTATTKATSNSEDELAGLPETFIQFVNSLPKSPNKKIFSKVIDNSDKIFENEGFMECEEFIAYPMQSGGYMTIYGHTISKYGTMERMSFDTYTYKDGSLKRAQNILPVPSLRTDNKAGHEADFNAFSSIYKKRPYDFIYYIIYGDEPTIRTALFPPAGKDPEWNEKYYDFISQSTPPSYRWDGEKFVQFDMFADFLNGLPKSPDKPVYHTTDGYGIQEQFCGTTLDYYAFPKTDGGYMAIASFNEQCEASMYWNDSTYIYKNGKIKSVDDILPVPEMITLLDPKKCKGKDEQVKNIIKQYDGNPRGYLLYRIHDDGTMNVSAEANGCENWGEIDLELMVDASYKWDGEKFVRTDNNAAAPADNNVAKEVFKKEFPSTKEIDWDKDTPLKCYGYPECESEGCGASESLACYPLKDGGYLVTFGSSFCGPGCADEYQFWTKKYKDGNLTVIKDILPLPKLEDLLDPDRAKNYQADVAKFKKELYDENPQNFICYSFQPPETLTVRLHPWDCEDAYYNMDKVMLDPYNEDKVPTYTWDGEKFVKQQ